MDDAHELLKDALFAAVTPGGESAPARFAREVAGLSAALRAAGDGLLRPAVRWAAAAPPAPDRVGPYRVLGVLGSGGMGVVYRAEQVDPVRREVAVKVLRPGAASPAALAGFEAERHALARLHHRNVAGVLDAGVTRAGPYLVMELVRGPTLCRHVVDRRVGLRERLELFAAVCRGVHHAHQRGVVHRDLKPGNVLVAEEDGRPVPKVIDFGVAKLLADPLAPDGPPAGASVAGLVGTLEYMSPELARDGLSAVDARADVYGLGAILYELLAGAPPFDPADLRRRGLAGALAAVAAGPPAPPSRRARPAGAAPPVSPRAVAGELDWVTGRATDPDPGRRYASAAALADDVGRYLAGRPVEAAPPSRWYAARKFVRRNAAAAATAAAVGVAVAAGAGLAAAGFLQARADRDRWRAATADAEAGRAEAVAARNDAVAAQARADAARDKAVAALDLTTDALLVAHDRDPATKLRLADIGRRAGEAAGPASPRAKFRIDLLTGQAHRQAGRADRADPLLTQAHAAAAGDWADPRERAGAALALSELRTEQGRAVDGLRLAEEAAAQAELTNDPNWRANTSFTLANALAAAGRVKDAADRLAALVASETARSGTDSPVAARGQVMLGTLLARLNKPDRALQAAEAGHAGCRRLFGLSHPDTAGAAYNLALIHLLANRPADAAGVLEDGRTAARRVLGPTHPLVLTSDAVLGRCYARLGRDDAAADIFRGVLADGDKAHGDRNPGGAPAADGLRLLHKKRGRHAEAVDAARAEVRYLAARHRPGDWRLAEGKVDLAESLLAAGRPAEAAAVAEAEHPALAAGPPPARALAARAARVAAAASAAGDTPRAADWRRRAGDE